MDKFKKQSVDIAQKKHIKNFFHNVAVGSKFKIAFNILL